MARQLLTEYLPFEVDRKALNEAYSSKGGGPLYVFGTLQRAEAKNHNGRVYPMEVLKPEVEKYMKEFVKQKRALGELDHPDSSVVNLAQVSHNIVDITWKGNDVIGKVEILKTPMGNILTELFRSGVMVGISSRGLGSVEEIAEGETKVLDDFELIAFDFVSNPSTHGAFLFPEKKNVSEGITGKAYEYDNINKIISDILCSTAGMCEIQDK